MTSAGVKHPTACCSQIRRASPSVSVTPPSIGGGSHLSLSTRPHSRSFVATICALSAVGTSG